MFELRKIGIVKRASALLLDAILLVVLTTGFMFIISLICKFDREQDLLLQGTEEWEEFTENYGEYVAQYFGYTFEKEGDERVMRKDGEAYSFSAVMEEFAALNGEVDYGKPNAEKVAEAYGVYENMALTPVGKLYAQDNYVFNLLFMMTSIGILLAFIVLEFVIPLIFKNGQTVGKKVFEIALVRTDCVKITTLSLFARTLLGKFAIETMFPVLMVFMFLFGGLGILAVVLFAAIIILNIVLFFVTKNRTPIHDLLAGTVAVDMKLQMIFASEEELIQKKSLAAKESVENTKS